MNDKIIQLFSHMDHLGYYTLSSWFTTLTPNKIRTFIYELYEIWNYRAQLTSEIKELICPPRGNPFEIIESRVFFVFCDFCTVVHRFLLICLNARRC